MRKIFCRAVQPLTPSEGLQVARGGVGRWLAVAVVAAAALAGTAPAAQGQSAHILRVAGSGAFDAQHLVFDGADDHVRVPHVAAHAVTNALTVEAWVRPTGAFVASAGIATQGVEERPWTFVTLGDGRLEAEVNYNVTGGSARAAVQSTGRLTLGVWQHVALTIGDGVARFYINGALAGESTLTPTFAATSEPLVVGADLPGGDEFFRGGIDEVRVWSVARTAAEIAANRTTVFGPTTAGLVGAWDFDRLEDLGVGDAGTNDVRDRSASGAHGDVRGGIARVTAWAMAATSDLYEDRVVVSWNRVASATARYLVRRDGLLVATLAAGDTTYTDRAGVAGRAYPYCVSRQDGPTTTALGCESGRRQLLAPAAVAATDGTLVDRVRITWSDRSAVNTGYRVYRAGALVATLGDVASYDDTATADLVAGTAYAFCVAPIQGDGEGPRVCDSGQRGAVLPPAAVAATDGTVPNATRITWAAPAGGDPAGTTYTVTRGGASLATLTGAYATTDIGGTPGTVYTYCVTRQAPSAAASAPVCDAGGQGTLPAPTAVVASDTTRDDRVDVRWASGGSGAASVVRVTRQGGHALAFDGVDDGVEIPGLTDSPSAVTVEAWIKPTGAFVDGSSVVTKGRTATPWSLLVTGDGRLRVASNFGTSGGSSSANVLSDAALTLGVWQHVAATIGEHGVQLFVDGVLVGQSAVPVVFGTNTEPTYLGSDLVGTVAYFRGEMDEVRVWSTVRTQAQLRAGLTTSASGTEDGLVAAYRLDDGVGTLVTDVRGGHHGRLRSMGTTATSGWTASTAPVAGQGMRPALVLDGTNDHAVASGLTALPASFTIEFWARRAAAGRSDFPIGQGAGGTNNGLNIGFRDNNHFILSFTGNDLDTPQPFSDTDWHHWAVTYDRATGARTIVRDGALVASDVTASPYTGTGTLRIGQSTGDGINGHFGGLISDVRVWSRVRAPGSIAAGRYALADTARAGLVAAWAFDGLDPAGTAALTTAPGTSASGSATGAVLTNGARLAAGRPLLLPTLAPTATSTSDATAEPGQLYTYCVSAAADAGASTAPACDTGRRARAVAPVIVVASDGEFETLTRVAWQSTSTRAATYNVYRGTDLVATLPATQASFDDKSGAPSTVYTYCVAALTAEGAESARACDAGGRVLRAPTVSASDATREDRVDVTWSDNSGAETGYRITRVPQTNRALTIGSGGSIGTYVRAAGTLNNAQAFTVEFWVKPTSLAGDRKLIVLGAYGADRTVTPSFVNGTFMIGFINNQLYPEVWDSNGRQSFSSGTVPDGVWSHIAVTYQSGGALIGYVNGVEVGRDASVGTYTPWYDQIGFGGFGTAVSGDVDDLRIWKVARTPAQVVADRERLVSPGEADLGGAWPLDEGTGSLSASSGGFSQAGTSTSMIVGPGASWTTRTEALPAAAVIAETAAGVTTYADLTAASGVAYTYGVAPVDTYGAGAAATDGGLRVLKPSSGLRVTSEPNEATISLAWTDNSLAEVNQTLTRTGGGRTLRLQLPRSQVQFTDTSPVLGVDYTYQIATEDTYGVSAPSEAVTGRTVLLPPASVSASDTYGSNVVVTWVDVSTIETGYVVTRDGVQIGSTLAANATTYTDATAAAGVTYTYGVQAQNGSALSAIVSDSGVRVPDPLTAYSTPLELLPTIIASPRGGGQFGSGGAVEGAYAAIGHPFADNTTGVPSATGAVVFMKFESGEWRTLTTIGTPECTSGGGGFPVALSGTYAVASCVAINRTFVFRRDGDTWTKVQTLEPPAGETVAGYGRALAMSGDYLLVGTTSTKVYAYKRRSTTWEWTQTLLLSNDDGNRRVVMDGATAAVSTPGQGQVQVFVRNSADAWANTLTIAAPSGVTAPGFGFGLSVRGDRILVAPSSGTSAYLYQGSGSTWTLRNTLRPTTVTTGEQIRGIALGADHAAFGIADRDDRGTDTGALYLFQRNGGAFGTCAPSGLCNESRRLAPTNAVTSGGFGTDVLLSSEALLAGGVRYGPSQQGAVFPLALSAAPGNVQASNGTYAARVQVTWEDRGSYEESFRIYRDGLKIGDVPANVRAFDDFDAPPGDLSTYCVASFRQGGGESSRECARGWRPADGVIGGRVATYSATGFGAGVADVNVCLAPPPNNALLVDGVGGYARGATVSTTGSALTVEAWVRPTGSAFVQYGAIATKGVTSAPWSFFTNSGGTLGLLLNQGAVSGGSGQASFTSAATLQLNQWQHVAATLSSDSVRFYINGAYAGGKTAATTLGTNAEDLVIGAELPGAAEFFRGSLDEVRVWNRRRTQGEILSALRVPLTGKESDLLAYYTFDQGTGPAGLDQTSGGAHAVLTGGASWTEKSSPVESCSVTNADGNFTLTGVRYSTGRTFTVEASLEGHTLQPARQTVTLNAQSPVQNSVAFVDASTYTVAGTVRHNTTSPRTGLAYGTCGIEGASLSSPGAQSVTTDNQGDFRIGLTPGTRTITVQKSGLSFAPDSYTVDLTADVSGRDFVAGPLRRLLVRTETAGGFAIGTHTLRIRSEDGCYDRTAVTDANGNFMDDLPPLRYTVTVTGTTLTPSTGLDPVDVDRYFTGLGAQTVDLTETSDTLSVAYRAPLRIALVGLPGATGQNAQTCAAPDRLGVPTLPQGLLYPLVYSVVEDFGALGSFPARDVRVQIVDEIADDEATPVDTTIAAGTIAYQTAVGQPNVLAGRVVDGVDRSHQKSIQFTATSGARTATRTDWAVVTGTKARNGSFVSFTTEEVPLYVLRDPPGDASYAYLEKGTGYCFTLADWSTSNSLGMVSSFSNMIGAHNLFLTAPLGVGVAVELRTGIGVQGGTNVNLTWRREGNTQVCLEAKERFSTSSDPEFAGADADVFIGAAFNMLFAQTDQIRVDGQSCAIDASTGFGIAPDPTKPVKNTYAYTTKHIRDVLIPQIQALKAAATPTDTTRYGTYIANWQRHLAYNASLKAAAAAVTGPEQRSFSGGADFAASFTSDTTYHHAWSTHMYNESGLGLQQALKIPVLEFNAGWQLKFTRETTFELPSVIGAPPMNGRTSLAERRTTGYVLSDRNSGDSYAVNVRPEKGSEVRVFVPDQIDAAAGIGYGAVGGVLSAVGGGLKVAGVVGGLAAYYAGRGATNGSILGSIIGTSLNLAFGLTQGAYDLGALLDPQAVTSAAVETKLRVPFGSPIFQPVAGTSSCPWQGDAVFAAAGGAAGHMLRRDLPTLAMSRTSLVNADPSKPAVFSLFLGNASESNETRRYVLRSVNERNPGGAIVRVNGTPIHEGVVFTLAPGTQTEATLSVERGPTRFRYDSLQVILYPECAGLPSRISEKEGATQTFSVSFKSVSSPVTLYTSPRFDLDFAALPDAALGDSLALADFTLDTIDRGDLSTTADDVYLTEVGVEYRPATSSVWQVAFAATRAQIIAASPMGAAATTYYTRWKPATSDVDGAYVFRAFTRSTGGGPAGATYYGEPLVGRIDRRAPAVFGTPDPSSGVLALGADVGLTFDEPLAASSVLGDSSVSALAAANLRLVYADGAEAGQRLRVRASASGARVLLTPVDGWAALEGRTVQAEVRVPTGAAPAVRPITDALGNALAAGQTWTFTVRRSALAWSAPVVATTVARGVAPRVTVPLANGRTAAADFTLSGVPAWLTPSVRSGTIAPGAVLPIVFTGADTLSAGVHTATVVATLGATTLPLSLSVTVDAAAPTWTVDPARFQHSMSVTAQLFVRGRPSVDAGDLVGAFVDGELRGVARVAPRTSAGQTAPDSNRVALTVYSNSESGELVSFKVWDADAATPVLYATTNRTLAYRRDGIVGTPTRPLALHAPYAPGTANLPLNAGWTWVSLPRVPVGARVSDMLAPVFGLSAASGDVVKSQRTFAVHTGPGGWVGPLADSLADPRQAYLVRLSASQELVVSTGSAALADTSGAIPLAAGWTWLGFPRSVAQPLDHALAASRFTTAPAAGDVVKSQTAFAQYVPGSGWLGSLARLEPGKGYMIKRATGASLTYPASPPSGAAAEAPDGVSASVLQLDPATLAVVDGAAGGPGGALVPSAFAHNLTALVTVEGVTAEAGMFIGAFAGDSLRGVAPLTTLPGSSRAVAFLMAYAHRPAGETLTFRLYDPATRTSRLLSPTLVFLADASVGTLDAPFVLRGASTTAIDTDARPTAFAVEPLAPNPFAAQTVLRYALPSAERVLVEVVDVMGRRVAVLVDGPQEAGRYVVSLDGTSLASGVYVVAVRAGPYRQTLRVTRVR